MLRSARRGGEGGSPHFSKLYNVVVECSRVPPLLPPPAELTIITINQHQHHNSRRENGSLSHSVSRPTFCVSSEREILRVAFDRVTFACEFSLNENIDGATTWQSRLESRLGAYALSSHRLFDQTRE
jgi:hypothetical protein